MNVKVLLVVAFTAAASAAVAKVAIPLDIRSVPGP
ncbi:hypothetical protein MY11210_009430, partial [Beauveria gryllotalpidicola]